MGCGVSTLSWILLGCLAFCLRFHLQGYLILRSDHLTQIPLLYVLEDPTLFPRDIFLHQFGSSDMRHFYLVLVRLAATPWGLPFGLFALYVLFFTLMIGASFRISKTVFDSYAPAVFFALILAFHHAGKVAANDILEVQILPRMIAFTACWWALCLVLFLPRPTGESGRPKSEFMSACFAGAILAAGAYIQVLVPLQIWPVLSLAILIWRGWKGIPLVLVLSATFLLLMAPSLFKTQSTVGSYLTTSPGSDIFSLYATIRNPHHILLSMWTKSLQELGALIALWAIVWWPLRRRHLRAWQFGLLPAMLIAILVAAAIVMGLWPKEKVLLIQPFRLAVPLRATMYLLLAYHIAELVGRKTFWAYARAAALVTCGLAREIFLCVLIAEMVIVLVEEYAPAAPRWLPAIFLIGALAAANILESDSRLPTLVALGAAGVGAWLTSKPQCQERLVRRGLPLAAACGALYLAAMWTLPFERWMGNPDSPWQRRLARYCFDHAPRPFPIAAIEKVGAWAERNTPKDALFAIPPEKEQAGFHPWAKRSVLLTIKFFPYSVEGARLWKERYLAVRGLTGASQTAIEAALHDLGGKHANRDYESLDLEKVREIVKTYNVDYIVSEHEPPYEDPTLPLVFETRDSDDYRSKPLRVYQVIRPPGPSRL